MSEAPRVSITIVAYNSADVIAPCLQSLRAAVRDGVAAVTVVDNGSPDASAALVAAEFGFAGLLRTGENRGFAAGCNAAWPTVKAGYWLLLNPDTVVPKGGIEALVAFMDEHPALGAASPAFVDSLGRVSRSGRRLPSTPRILAELTRAHLLLPRRLRAWFLLGSYDAEAAPRLDCDWVPGAALIVRRAAVAAAGLMSEDLFLYGEDMEWCHRIRQAGFGIGACNELVFTHAESTSIVRTFGEAERDFRMWRGMHLATRKIRGRARAALILRLLTLAQWLESRHPRRSAASRARSARQLRAARAVIRGREAPLA
jgi:GT2 family glycosyltransferase